MNRSETLIFFFILFSLFSLNAAAQTGNDSDNIDSYFEKRMKSANLFKLDNIEVNEEELLKMVDALPAFGVYKDTYFTTGIPLDRTITNNTADVLFQISIRHRITRSRLPFNSFLYLTYTQKSFWNLYAESSPFRDTNYNPSIGVGKYIIHKNKLKGAAFFQLEHESNGRDGEESRSWNMISLSTKFFFNMQLSLGAKVWLPIVDGENNSDLTDYKGYGSLSINYITKRKKWWLAADITPRKGFGNANTLLTAGYKVSRNANQYIYAQFFNGRGESLLDYNKYEMNFRLGFCIKPDFGSIF